MAPLDLHGYRTVKMMFIKDEKICDFKLKRAQTISLKA